jgi:hypothetical protein
LRELALGIEGLEQFVANAPLRQVHECVFGVLDLESEPVDLRLCLTQIDQELEPLVYLRNITQYI